MIKFKYSLKEDLKWSFKTLKNLKWLRRQKLVVFYPNPFRMIYLWIKKPKIEMHVEENIICYWIHAGTWGAYTPPNKIYICPWDIEKAGGLEKVIEHEIVHLKYEKDVQEMTHEEKEDFINRMQKHTEYEI